MRKYLTQAMIAESVSRLEDAARTLEDFKNVIAWWDKREKRIQDALDKKVLQVATETFDTGLYRKGDHKMRNVFGTRTHYHEDFLVTIHGCICHMHDLTDDIELSRLIHKATDKQKLIFFPRVIVGCKPQKIAACHEMTDRNVRDIVDRMVSKIRKGIYPVLKERDAKGVPLTIEQRNFMNTIDEEKAKEEAETAVST